MAKQKGIIKIQGTLGDITFTKTQDGYLAREKTTVNASRVASDPAFQRTRENMSEFGRAGKAGKLLRNAIRSLLQNAKDNRVTSRLTKEMMKVLKADATSIRGLRNVIDGETEMLTGFEFNNRAVLSTTLYPKYTQAIDRVTGQLTVDVPAFVPTNEIVAPDGATHFKIVSAAAAIDFSSETYTDGVTETAVIPWNADTVAAVSLTHALTPNSTHPLFLLLGIQFFQQVNGTNYSLKNGAFNALSIVAVSGV